MTENISALIARLTVMLLMVCGCTKNTGNSSKQVPPAPVLAAEVIQTNMPVEIRTFGTIESCASINVRSQISGILTNINFREGQDINKGDLLFSVDSSLQGNELKQAQAALTKDLAQEENATREAQRQDELLKKGLTSKDIYEQAKTTADSCSAIVKSDEAAVENARIMLSYCSILSPIDGRTGKHLVDRGNLVKANDTVLNTINQIKPIKVSFSVPEQNLAEISKQMTAGRLEVKVSLQDSAEWQETGFLTFIDNAVDRSTGTINLKATFDNKNGILWPGQFVLVSITLSIEENVIVVPAQAVMKGQNGTFVFVISKDQKAENRNVKTARQVNNLVVISDGLKAGEAVIVEGQQRVGSGTKVDIRNPAPASSPATKQ